MASAAKNPLSTNFSTLQNKSPGGSNNVHLGEQFQFLLMQRRPLTLSGTMGYDVN
jgi:hypothetical protein